MYEVHVSTCNDELVIAKCLTSLTQVFSVKVHDFGSTDNTAEIAKSFPVKYQYVGKLDASAYTKYKSSIGNDKVFWVDSDEEYPIPQLLKVKQWLEDPQGIYLCGYWRYVLPKGGETVPTLRGRIAWQTQRMGLVRAWPRERLDGDLTLIEEETNFRLSEDLGVWCYHHVLMKRSNKPEDKARSRKRAEHLAKTLELSTVQGLR